MTVFLKIFYIQTNLQTNKSLLKEEKKGKPLLKTHRHTQKRKSRPVRVFCFVLLGVTVSEEVVKFTSGRDGLTSVSDATYLVNIQSMGPPGATGHLRRSHSNSATPKAFGKMFSPSTVNHRFVRKI